MSTPSVVTLQELFWKSYGSFLAADGAMYRESAPHLYDAPHRSSLAAAQMSEPAVQQRDRTFMLYPVDGGGPTVPAKPHDLRPSGAQVVCAGFERV